MLDLADEINQKRGIALIKVNGREVFYDQDYFGYDDFQAIKVEWENLKKVSDLIKEDVDRILWIQNGKMKNILFQLEQKQIMKN